MVNTAAGNVALPPVSVTGVPTFELSMVSCTVPVGVPPPGATGATAAAKVIASPGNAGFFDDVTVVAVLALLTICWLFGSCPVLDAKFASPLYVPTIVYLVPETASVEVWKVATPAESAAGAPLGVPLIENCTEPVGVPDPDAGATVAVKVTAWPKREGLPDVVTTVVVAGRGEIVSVCDAGVRGLVAALSVTVSVGAPAVPSL